MLTAASPAASGREATTTSSGRPAEGRSSVCTSTASILAPFSCGARQPGGQLVARAEGGRVSEAGAARERAGGGRSSGVAVRSCCGAEGGVWRPGCAWQPTLSHSTSSEDEV